MGQVACSDGLTLFYLWGLGITRQTVAALILCNKGDGPGRYRFGYQSQGQLGIVVIPVRIRRNVTCLKCSNRGGGIVAIIIPTNKYFSLRQSHFCTTGEGMLRVGIVFNGIVRRLRTIQSYGVRVNIVNGISDRIKLCYGINRAVHNRCTGNLCCSVEPTKEAVIANAGSRIGRHICSTNGLTGGNTDRASYQSAIGQFEAYAIRSRAGAGANTAATATTATGAYKDCVGVFDQSVKYNLGTIVLEYGIAVGVVDDNAIADRRPFQNVCTGSCKQTTVHNNTVHTEDACSNPVTNNQVTVNHKVFQDNSFGAYNNNTIHRLLISTGFGNVCTNRIVHQLRKFFTGDICLRVGIATLITVDIASLCEGNYIRLCPGRNRTCIMELIQRLCIVTGKHQHSCKDGEYFFSGDGGIRIHLGCAHTIDRTHLNSLGNAVIVPRISCHIRIGRNIRHRLCAKCAGNDCRHFRSGQIILRSNGIILITIQQTVVYCCSHSSSGPTVWKVCKSQCRICKDRRHHRQQHSDSH